jgi:hypothetical protein
VAGRITEKEKQLKDAQQAADRSWYSICRGIPLNGQKKPTGYLKYPPGRR